ncbi:MAG: 4-hydroxy-tetrahydrodipicolinate synthase [Deltaproteobacteria bacterium]|nr:4-hydroxy-tetrahydrodipicolinate synthase [Deltaproteobacteria bacterium]
MRFKGAYTALVTPFTSGGDLDVEAVKKILRQQIDGGIDGLVVAGTTGESPTLSEDEKRRYTELALEAARGKVPVIVGTGTNATRSTVLATKAAKSWGADAALVVCPYYNKPTQEGLFRHFQAVHQECGLPVVAYNVPGRTASDLLPETIARLVEIGAIAAVKDATANMQRAIETLAIVDRNKPFDLVSGDDFTILPFVACGGTGVISVVSNLVPGDTARLVRETAAGNWSVARPLQTKLVDLSRALFSVSSPIPVKAGMSMLGLCTADLRLPLVAADEKTRASVKAAMERYGALL